jgi:hypothetical protein
MYRPGRLAVGPWLTECHRSESRRYDGDVGLLNLIVWLLDAPTTVLRRQVPLRVCPLCNNWMEFR